MWRGSVAIVPSVADMASSVKLANHNDYIAPSQGCVVTLKGLKPSAKAFDDSQVRIHDKQSSHVSVSTGPVKVSLHDCLACSGCITTAETVMLEQQSTGVWCGWLNYNLNWCCQVACCVTLLLLS